MPRAENYRSRRTLYLKRSSMVFRTLILLFLSLQLFACPSSDNAKVEVIGTIKIKTFPGAPEYTSIKNGDKAETYFFIESDKKICFSPDGKFLTSQVEVSNLQLVLKSKNIKLETGKKYKISGTTFPSHTGHHHSDVLLEVESAKKI